MSEFSDCRFPLEGRDASETGRCMGMADGMAGRISAILTLDIFVFDIFYIPDLPFTSSASSTERFKFLGSLTF